MNEARTPPLAGLEAKVIDAVPSIRADVEAPDLGPALPGDHPAWQRDVLSISGRARALIAALRPFALHVLSFWDHRVREIMIGSRKLGVDPSGSYRLD